MTVEMDQHSRNVELKDRLLWVDGDSSFHPKILASKALNGFSIDESVFVTQVNSDVERFNKLTGLNIGLKTDVRQINNTWNLPEKYRTLNIVHYLSDKIQQRIIEDSIQDDKLPEYLERVKIEYNLFKSRDLLDVLRTAIYIVDTFTENRIVWGTGRGSACSSYILYLIGIHEVDSVYYELDIREFFKD